MAEGKRLLTFGYAAHAIGCMRHHLDRLANREAIPFVWVGRSRAVREEDLPAIRETCRRWNYLVAEQPEAVHAAV